ncbi:hypothetical protein [Parvularcula oceani]|uniref:hypothetical protein n=1 Tax=Parvularcula oceani TaxID=1247963 RepID=UPI0004E25AB2|nr:hypothetical protein [Parvularcula oceani]
MTVLGHHLHLPAVFAGPLHAPKTMSHEALRQLAVALFALVVGLSLAILSEERLQLGLFDEEYGADAFAVPASVPAPAIPAR